MLTIGVVVVGVSEVRYFLDNLVTVFGVAPVGIWGACCCCWASCCTCCWKGLLDKEAWLFCLCSVTD